MDICNSYHVSYIPSKFQNFKRSSEHVAQNCPRCPKVQGGITFDSKAQLKNKLDFHQGSTCVYIESKFYEHPTKNDSIGTT